MLIFRVILYFWSQVQVLQKFILNKKSLDLFDQFVSMAER